MFHTNEFIIKTTHKRACAVHIYNNVQDKSGPIECTGTHQEMLQMIAKPLDLE